MRSLVRTALIASSMFCLAIPVAGLFAGAASAQAPALQQAAPGGPENENSGQVPLTEKQILAVIAAQASMAAILDKIPEDQRDNPPPRVLATLDKAAKSAGFRDFGAYENVVNNIVFILEGFDPEKKAWVGPEVILKQQIAQVSADSKLTAKEKAKQLKELNNDLASVEPVRFPGNITLVAKYFDKLDELFGEED